LDDPAGKTVVTIDIAIERYLREVKATKSDATLSAYRHDLTWFREDCNKHYVSRLNRDDAIALFAVGRDEGLNQKTVNKRVIVMLQAMRGAGAVIELKKGDWPKTVEKQVEIYESEELKQFFAECNQRERLLFQVFLCTGFRSREVATLSWDDVDWKAGSIVVRGKSELRFTPKSYEERSVPVPGALMAAMKKLRRLNPNPYLVFPTPPHPKRPKYGGDKPEAHALEACKGVAYQAGLNCGHCKTKQGKCRTGPHCKRWYLHKWRHTFATNMLQSKLDIRSLQVLLGHKNIATTEKYLKSLRLGDLRDKIEQSTLAAFL
jgi:integrase/recombinase XerD